MTERPFVSVIVPVYNDPDGIRQCLESLTSQTYPEACYEVIVVDNGSTDNTVDVIQEFPVQLEFERKIQGSYAARNAGIAAAGGDVLTFTDADCDPHLTWIEEGVAQLHESDADLAGGRVNFSLSTDPSVAARFDARANMRNDKGVLAGYAKTANLFVRSSVVDDIGNFPSDLRSGGDVYWTRSATEQGFDLVYAAEAIVEHPPRELAELVKKQYRVGKGHVDLWQLEGRNPIRVLARGLVKYPSKVFTFIFENETDSKDTAVNCPETTYDTRPGVAFLFVAGLCVFAMSMGRLVALISWEG